ncbi:MAG TPA: glycosyltransferase [Planctomycetes bacterium]|nr:glycosyltransferase [Planctomycetota bacterium]
MNILLVVHQFLPRHAAGTEIYSFYLGRELARRGHEVSFYVTEFDGDRPQYELKKKSYEGLPVWEAVHNHHFPTFESHYKDEKQEENLLRVLEETRPDIVHLEHLHFHSIGYIDLLKERGIPIAYTLHEYILMCPRHGQLLKPDSTVCEGPVPSECAKCVDFLPPPDAKALPPVGAAGSAVKKKLPGGVVSVLGRIRRWFHGAGGATATVEPEAGPSPDPWVVAIEKRREEIQKRLKKVDLFISPSAFLRDKFIENGWIAPTKIIHSDNGFEVSPFAHVQRTKSDKLRIGFVGTIAPYKGVHLIVEACRGLDPSKVECKIHGDLDTFPDYGAQLREMEKPDFVSFEGRFDNSKIADVLASIDVLVVPSLWFENSPLTIHEAFLAGIPVITADRGGMAELVEEGKTGMHFRFGDAQDLRRCLRALVEDESLLPSLCRAFPHIKSIEEDTDLMLERYQALLAGERPRC